MKFLQYFSIRKSGKFYRKITVQSHRMAAATFLYRGQIDGSVCPSHSIDRDRYLVKHGLVTRSIDVFWLWFVLSVETKFDLTSEHEYVKVTPISKTKSIYNKL